MSTSPEPGTLARALDDALGGGPPLPPVEQHLAAGRRVVRRRRAVAGLSAAAVVAVLGTTYAVAAGGQGASTPDTGTADAGRADPDPRFELEPGQPVGYTPTGDVMLRDGLVALETIEDPLPVPAGHHADAVSVRLQGRVTYFLLSSDGEEWSSLARAARTRATPTLASYVEQQRESWDGDTRTKDPGPASTHGSPSGPLVRYTLDGQVVLREDLVEIERISEPLPWAEHSDAITVMDHGHAIYYVMWSDGQRTSVFSGSRSHDLPTLQSSVDTAPGDEETARIWSQGTGGASRGPAVSGQPR